MKPLDGVLVADFSRVLAAPMATQILADFGANVIKVEQPGIGDETRAWEPRLARDSGYFFAFNRGKQSLTLDLKSAAGRAVARDLAIKADVLVENFPVGRMAGFGLSYADLRGDNPALVYISNTGFGQFGPDANKIGYDTVFQAMGGLMSLTGEKGGDPVKAGLPFADLTSGLWLVIAALTGLAGRGASGRGCHVDVAMMDIQVSLLTIAAARYFALGTSPEREGTEHPGRVPSAAFECAGGEWVQISGSDRHWLPLCELLGLDDLAADEDLRGNAARVRRRDEVMPALREAVRMWTRPALVAGLEERRVPVGPVNSIRQILEAPHTKARGMVGAFDYPGVGRVPALRNPLLLDGFDNPDIKAPPELGADTESVLAEVLGYDRDRIEELKRQGVT